MAVNRHFTVVTIFKISPISVNNTDIGGKLITVYNYQLIHNQQPVRLIHQRITLHSYLMWF